MFLLLFCVHDAQNFGEEQCYITGRSLALVFIRPMAQGFKSCGVDSIG
ncbi:hypothetical protein [Acinetobacter lanii]|uniref:Uncharacterized protein n=1 Tax=Acinetobacter lanii TaxID=2715163 RepID=A0A6G8S338_9GAMM|nr:hypothetical protein [Acinetobacter lanii]QIO08428.1 hypothetical protein G8D99_04950 [Acinetobacter lanii]